MKLASVRRMIDSTEDGLASVILAGSNAEGEYRGIKELLVDHVVERWGDVVDRNPVVCKTKDSIEPAMRVNETVEKMKMVDSLSEGKGETWLLGCLRKVLALDCEVANGQDVIGNESLH